RAGQAALRLGRDLDAEYDELAVRTDKVLEDPDPLASKELSEALLERARMMQWSMVAAVGELNLGSVYGNLALPEAALPHLERAMALLDAVSRVQDEELRRAVPPYRAAVLAASGAVKAQLGDLSGAIRHGEEAVAILRSTGPEAELAGALGGLGATHAIYGGYDEALRLTREALELLPEDGEEVRLERLRLRINEGHALQETGRGREAAKVLRGALDGLAGPLLRRERAVALLNLAEVLEKEGEFEPAEAMSREALEAAGTDRVLRAYARMGLGRTVGRRGGAASRLALESALGEVESAARELLDAGEPRLRMLLATERGALLLALGRVAEAGGAAAEGLALLDRLTGRLADGEVITGRDHEDRRRLFALAVRAALASGDPAAVFVAMERSRAQAFLSALGGRKRLLEAVASPVEAENLRQASLRSAACFRRQREAMEIGAPQVLEANRRLDAARAEEDALLHRIERSSRIAAGASPPVPEIAAVRGRLGPEAALVEFAVLEEGPVALILGPEGARIARLSAARDLDAVAVRLKEAVARRAEEEVSALLGELAKLVLEPLALPAGLRRLFVSPDGPLLRLPWPELVARSMEGDVETWLVPSAGALLALDGRAKGPDGPRIAVGDPRPAEGAWRVYVGGRLTTLGALPAAREEAALVASRTGDVLLAGAGATEAALAGALAAAGRVSALHFACHGLVDVRNPSRSCLALAPGEGGDGFLTALEIYRSEIPADLVVLSACETAGDRAAGGEGLLGLTRAFLLAGAPRVLAGLWPMDDAASGEFMRSFYREYGRPGATVALAFARARRSVEGSEAGLAGRAAWVVWGVPD
ncbi:MAG: CHAT domain-containing tetratricopeptide repeat protein, partial [Planctomycetes bacterium]|nr:CHAT domain-containing tetratricopeptide repeat protein [Planctomycetota bacterium]